MTIGEVNRNYHKLSWYQNMNKIKRSNWWQINKGTHCSLTIKRVSWAKLYCVAEIILGIISPEILTFKKNILDKITFWGYTYSFTIVQFPKVQLHIPSHQWSNLHDDYEVETCTRNAPSQKQNIDNVILYSGRRLTSFHSYRHVLTLLRKPWF